MESSYQYKLSVLSNVNSLNTSFSTLSRYSGAVSSLGNNAVRGNSSLSNLSNGIGAVIRQTNELDNQRVSIDSDTRILSMTSNLITQIRNKVGAAKLFLNINTNTANNSISSLRDKIAQVTMRRDISLSTNEIKAANKEISLLETKLRKLENLPNTNKIQGSLSNLKSIFSGIGASILGIGAIGGLASFGGEVIKVTSEFDKYQAVLTNSLGSSVLASHAMKDLQTFAKNTPYALNQVTDSFVKYVGRGLAPTIGEMTNIADLSAALGKDFGQLSEAILDVNNTERWTELGINVKTEGNKIIGTYKGVTQTVQRSEQGALNMAIAFGKMKGVAGTSKEVSSTMGGQINNLGDTFNELKVKIGSAISPLVNLGTKGIAAMLGFGNSTIANTAKFEKFGAWVQANEPLVVSAIQGMGIAVGALSAGFLVLNATMLLNPIGLIVAAVAAGAVGFSYFWATSEKFRATMTGIWEVSKNLFSSFWENGKTAIGGLIDLVSGLVMGMKAAIEMDFAGAAKNFTSAWEGAKKVATVSAKSNPLVLLYNAKNISKDITSDFNKGYNTGEKDFREIQKENNLSQKMYNNKKVAKDVFEKEENDKINSDKQSILSNKKREKKYENLLQSGNATIADVEQSNNPSLSEMLNFRKGAVSGISSGISGAVSGGNSGGNSIGNVTGDSKATKNITVNINTLIGSLNVNTTNITEGTSDIKKLVSAAILDAVNDVNYTGR